MENKILCCIFNYNENEKALKWRDRLAPHFDTVVLDSGSNPPCRGEGVINLDNIFYSGLMNTAYEMLLEKDFRWLMIVTSDIEINDRNASLLVSRMKEVSEMTDVALYQPSCRLSFKGRCHRQSLCHYSGKMRSVNFQEGWFHLANRSVLEDVLPIDIKVNRLGWGIDLALSHFARIRKMPVLVDDKVKVLHPKGTGYKKDEAKDQMEQWLATIQDYESPRHFKARKFQHL